MRLLTALTVPWLFLLAACPPPSPPSPEDPAPDVVVDAGPVFAACESNADCVGGEVCRDDECRTACETDADCGGDFAVCSVDAGICVACIDDTSCSNDERCVDNSCAFFCNDDAQCGSGAFCREEYGTCEDIECEANADCMGGFRCDDFLCVSIDVLVCEPSAQRCDGDTRVVCSADGTDETRTECEGGEACALTDGVATCLVTVCTPNALGCVDMATAFACSADGTVQQDLPCAGNESCTEGVCRTQQCMPDEVVCAGNALATCSANGFSQSTVSCLDEALCPSDNGCQCTPGASGATCEARICVPGHGQCAGDGARVCLDDGSGYGDVVACDENEACTAGVCLSSSCTAGATQCAGPTLLTCDVSGNGYAETDCAATSQLCVGDGEPARCADRLCTPGALRCNVDGTAVVICDDDGATETSTDCGDGETCQQGACSDQACAPNATRCEGNTLFTCTEDGLDETSTLCMYNEACSDVAGACERREFAITLEPLDGNAAFQLSMYPSTVCGENVVNAQNPQADWDGTEGTANDPQWEGNGATQTIRWSGHRVGAYGVAVENGANTSAGYRIAVSIDGGELVSYDSALVDGALRPYDFELTETTLAFYAVSSYESQGAMCGVPCVDNDCVDPDLFCSTQIGACVESAAYLASCVDAESCVDGFGAPEMCSDTNVCVESNDLSCETHLDCNGWLCEPNAQICVDTIDCMSDVDCPGRSYCNPSLDRCQSGCGSDDGCTDGEVCNDDNWCIDPSAATAEGEACLYHRPTCALGFTCSIFNEVCTPVTP